jgi:hypothetical protein
MQVEGNVGADLSLLASAADLASAAARAQSVGSNLNLMTAAAPSNLTAPSSVVLAATMIPVKNVSGLVYVSFDFYFTDSAADTVTLVIQQVANATAVNGGGASGQWRVENGGTAVSITGGSATTIETITKTITASAQASDIHAGFYTVGTVGQNLGLQFIVSASHNLSAMIVNGIAASN